MGLRRKKQGMARVISTQRYIEATQRDTESTPQGPVGSAAISQDCNLIVVLSRRHSFFFQSQAEILGQCRINLMGLFVRCSHLYI